MQTNQKKIVLFLAFFILGIAVAPVVTAQTVDTDGDGIYDDGNGNGTVGDIPCTGGNTSNCDDNCVNAYNPDQADSDGDGIGNACEDNALDFSSGGNVQITGGSVLDIGNKELTVEAWVKGGGSDLRGGIFSMAESTALPTKPLDLWVKDNMLKFGVTTSPTSTPDAVVGGLGAMLSDIWYHIAGVLTNSAHTHPVSASCSGAVMAETPHLDMYVNGEFSNCATTGSSFALNQDSAEMSIGKLTGAHPWYTNNPRESFNGEIDEVRFWTVARTETEIQGCMKYELGTFAGCEIDAAILKGYWRLDEGLGTVVTDSSGNGYSGDINGSVVWIEGYPFADIHDDTDGDGYTWFEGDCNDGDGAVHPGATEVCDGKDNDCDISTADGSDEGWLGNVCDGADVDVCLEGVFECSGGVQSCTDNTGEEDEICDGVDNDCDGSVDEDLGTTTCGIGVCERTMNNCVDGQIQICSPGTPTESLEITCNDSLDNDCDTLTDMSDTDCSERDNALDFSSGGHVQISGGSELDIGNKELTVEAWVKGGGSDLRGGIFSMADATGLPEKPLDLWVKDNMLKFGVTTSPTSTPDAVVGGLGAMLSDIWYHIAGVLTNSAHSHPESASCSTAVMAETPHLDMYVNGDFSNCATTGSSFALSQDSVEVSIGKLTGFYPWYMNNPGESFNGEIDEVRFWTVARTEAEIQGCMHYELGTFAGCEIDAAILKGYWRLDEGLGTVVTDSSGNGYSGGIVGSGVWVSGYPYSNIHDDTDGDGYTWFEGDCNDGDGEVHPGATEVCDGKDNDCDISTADGSEEGWLGNACDGADLDICMEGVFECSGGVQSCTDNTGEEEEVCDGIDNDCNGSVDEDLGTTTCGIGVCERTMNNCVDGQIQICSPGSPTESLEITCNDSLDNDCDTLIDMSDTDCSERDNSLDFSSGGNVQITGGSVLDIGNKELTVEAWVKGGGSDLRGGIFSMAESTALPTKPLDLWVKDNMLKFGVTTSPTSTPDAVVGGLGAMLSDIWYHIAGVLTNSAHTHPESASCSTAVMAETPHLDMYVNGEFSNCATTGSSFALNQDSAEMSIGKLTGAHPWYTNNPRESFNGEIDEVRFWTVARTETEIQGCMKYELGTFAGCEIDAAILKGYWRLDEGLGTVVTDSSGNGYSGDINGSVVWIEGYPFADIHDDTDGDGYTWFEGDCNDGDGAVHPGATEVCDGKDNDCDISTADGSDEGWLGNVCDGADVDVCLEGVFECSGGVQSCTDNTGSEVEICDGLDNDCNGSIDDNLFRPTICGLGQCSGNTGTETCIAGSWVNNTCDPLEGATTEVCDNIDNNCDGSTDENVINELTCNEGLCSGQIGTITCIAGSWVNSTCNPVCVVTVQSGISSTTTSEGTTVYSSTASSSTDYYPTLQEAYNATGDSETILSRAEVFTENLNIDRNISVTLDGGYNCEYTDNNSGMSTINGNLTISDGKVTIRDFMLFPARRVSGSGSNYPEPGFTASLSLNVDSSLETSQSEYYYTLLRLNFRSTSITDLAIAGNTATITGIGDATMANGADCISCGFTIMIVDNEISADEIGIEILNPDSTTYFRDPSGGSNTSRALSSGDFSIEEE